MIKYSKIFLAVSVLSTLSACALTPMKDLSNKAQDQEVDHAINSFSNKKTVLAQPQALKPAISERSEAYIPLVTRKASDVKHKWLNSVKVSVSMGSDPVPLVNILSIFAAKGINITSELPLDKYSYAGFSLTDVNAESALRTVLGASSLDYTIDSDTKVVTIKPIASKTWYLNTGRRTTKYESEGAKAAGETTSSANTGSANSGGTGGVSGVTGSTATGTSKISASDDFWKSLKEELESRLKVTVLVPDNSKQTKSNGLVISALPSIPSLSNLPVPGQANAGIPTPGNMQAPALPTTAGVDASKQNDNSGPKYVTNTIGNYSINPETGAISVQAPSWVLEGLDSYFDKVQQMYNTDLVFEGEVIMLTTTKSDSEGLDIAGFANYANNKYGLLYQTSGSNVTVSIPKEGIPIQWDPAKYSATDLINNIPSISASGRNLTGPMLGLRALNGLQLFSNYLTNLGKVTILQKPVISTTSGIPADFRKTIVRYYNTVSQQVASSTATTSVATTNTLIPQEFGTTLRVNPRYDTGTGLVRAQIELVQTIQVGTQTIPQAISAGAYVSQMNANIPVVSRILYSGEALLKDGDLIVMGGQTEDTDQATRDGLTGLMDGSAGSAFGKTEATHSKDVFYFAVKVSVNKRK